MTGSEFKFLRRVRIHDGECGAVARALHHAAQKVALVRNEQSLISDEKAFSRQADSKKAFGSTFNERKQMSTKTSIKRIALVAVSALGFGLVTVAPASASTLTCTALVGGTTVQAGVASVVGTCDVSAAVTTSDDFLVEVPTGPEGGTFDLASIGDATFAHGGIAVGATAASSTNATAAETGTGVENVTGTFDTPGVYTLKIGAATAVTVTVLPASNSTSALTASNNAEVYLAGTDSPVITISRNAGGVLADGTIKLQVVSARATAVVGAVYGGNTATAGVTVANSTNARTFTFSSGTFATSGSYTFTAFNDRNNNDIIDSGESTVAASFSLAAAAADLTVSTSRSTVADDTATSIVITVCAVTSTGGATRLASLGTATIDVDVDLWTSATTAVTLAAAGFGRVATTGCYQTTKTTATGLITAGSADATITVDLDGSTTTTADTGTAVVTSQQVSNGTSLVVTDQAGVTGDAASTATAAGTALTAATTVTGFAFTAAGTAGNYVGVTVTAGASTSIAKSSITSSRFLVGADGFVSFPLTITGPAAADVFTVTLDMATDVSYVITYAAAAPAFTLLPGANLTDKFGATNTITATLQDVHSRPYASATVIITVTGRNPSTTLATTDAAGKVSVTVRDASTSTTLLTDTVTFSHSYLATATATTNTTVTGARTITYSATGNVVGSVTVTSAAGPVDIDQVQAIPGVAASASRVTYTAQVRDASGNAVAAGVPVVFAGGADDLFHLGATLGVTDANGQATASVYRNKTGFAVITATAAGVTGSALPVQWVNTTGSDDHRNITIKAEPASVVSAGTTTITATVTDRWGNGVSGVSVQFAELGSGRLSTTSAVNTNAAGIASIDFTSNAGETGTNTVSATISGGQTSNLAGFVGATSVAGVTAGNNTTSTTVTITKDTSVSTADALLELAKAIGTGNSANAAADAALEAIDAANAATDAANLAAEAADAATVAAEEARDAADAATAAVEALSAEVATLVAALKAQITTLANTVAKIAKRVRA